MPSSARSTRMAALCLRNTGTCQANAVQTEYISRLPGYNHKRRHVLIYMRLPANHGAAADFAELMHGSKTADNGTVLNRYMPCQSCHIRHNNIVAYNAVMCNVGISHHQKVIADNCFVAFAGCTVYRGAFTENAAVTDNGGAVFTGKFQVLRHCADGTAGEEGAVFAYRSMFMDNGMRIKFAAIANYNIIADNGISADFNVFVPFSPAIPDSVL